MAVRLPSDTKWSRLLLIRAIPLGSYHPGTIRSEIRHIRYSSNNAPQTVIMDVGSVVVLFPAPGVSKVRLGVIMPDGHIVRVIDNMDDVSWFLISKSRARLLLSMSPRKRCLLCVGKALERLEQDRSEMSAEAYMDGLVRLEELVGDINGLFNESDEDVSVDINNLFQDWVNSVVDFLRVPRAVVLESVGTSGKKARKTDKLTDLFNTIREIEL